MFYFIKRKKLQWITEKLHTDQNIKPSIKQTNQSIKHYLFHLLKMKPTFSPSSLLSQIYYASIVVKWNMMLQRTARVHIHVHPRVISAFSMMHWWVRVKIHLSIVILIRDKKTVTMEVDVKVTAPCCRVK